MKSVLSGLVALSFVVVVGCGDPIVSPTRNLTRPTAISLVTDPTLSDGPEYGLLLDTELQQVVLFDAGTGLLQDLHPEIPGFNGAFLGGLASDIAARADGTAVAITNLTLGLLQVVCTPVASDCPTPRVIAEIDVGELPEKVVIIGNRAYVSRPRAGQIIEVDLDTFAVVGFFEVGGTPRGLAPSADGTRLYVSNSSLEQIHKVTLATRIVTAIPIGYPTENVFVSPEPEWIYAVRFERGSLLVVDPVTETLVNTNPDGPPGIGPDIVIPGLVTSMSFVRFEEDEAPQFGAGQFGIVSTTAGAIFGIYTETDASRGFLAHKIVDRDPPPVPSITQFPFFSIDNSPAAVTETTPVLIGYNTSALNNGITFTQAERVVRTEGWSMTYEGVISATSLGEAQVEPGGLLTSSDIIFQDLVIEGTSEKILRDGDYVVFLDASSPKPGVDCSSAELDERGRLRRWKVRFSAARPDALQIDPIDGLPPVDDCYTAAGIAYELRVANSWAVIGSTSGYQGRAMECPNATEDCTPFVFQSPFFSATIRAGTFPSVQGMRWAFTVRDGVNAALISISSNLTAAPLPTDVAFSKRSPHRVFVVDQGNDSVVLIDLISFSPVLAIR